MDNEFDRQLVTFLLGGGVAATFQALYKIRTEKDSITVATSGQVLEMQQKVLISLQKEIEDNRKECHDEMARLREQCRVELETSQQEARLMLADRDNAIIALRHDLDEARRSIEELRKNANLS